MFSPVSGSHFHPEPVHVVVEPHQPAPPAPSINVSIHVPAPALPAGHVQTALHLPADYISRPAGKLQPDLAHPGLQIDEKGRRFIVDGKDTYAVRFDSDNQTQRVYQPSDPAKPGIPVRLNATGAFELHADVGLKGGSPGSGLAQRFRAEKVTRESYAAEESRARYDLAVLDSEIQRSSSPSADLRARRDNAARALDGIRSKLDESNRALDRTGQEANQLRSLLRNELSDKVRNREEGRRLEQATLLEMNVLQAATNVSGQPAYEQHNKMASKQSELQRIQSANMTLDHRIASLNLELAEISMI